MMKRSWLIKLAMIWGAWTLAALVYSSHLYVFHNLLGKRATWWQTASEAFQDFYVWALLCPLILYLAKRFPISRTGWRKALLVHIPASLLVSLVQVALHTVVTQIVEGYLTREGAWEVFRALFARTYHFGLIPYWVMVLVWCGIQYYKDRELRASQLQTRLAQAELQALKMQLHPHFLFNTLHAISALMQQDVKAADRMVARLSDLLRISLQASNIQEVPLWQELEFLEGYLEIEKTRFQDRLKVEMNIAPETLDATIPNLILQPLVENSIRHGIAKHRGAGLVEIRSEKEDGRLRVLVRDNGAGLPDEGCDTFKEGIGLSNTRARLQQLYGSKHDLQFRNAPGGGLVVTLLIPFSTNCKEGDGDE
jgi:two-component system LytT family sensor kinase